MHTGNAVYMQDGGGQLSECMSWSDFYTLQGLPTSHPAGAAPDFAMQDASACLKVDGSLLQDEA
jgi:hypothetical protein